MPADEERLITLIHREPSEHGGSLLWRRDMPVTVEEIKTHLRIENDAEDKYLTGLLSAARTTAEDFCRCSFSEDMPEPVRLAIYLYVGFMYTYREGASRDAYQAMRQAFEALLWPHRDPEKIL